MNRVAPFLKTIVAYPPTWIALAVVIVIEFGIATWFQPPPVILVLVIAIGVALFFLWPLILIRSPDFERLHVQSRHTTSMEEFSKLLEGCYPPFGPPATDCWTLAERIRQEFGSQSFGGEVESAIAKLTKLTESHVKFYLRSQQFGDAEQKKDMEARILKQVERVENTRSGLLRLGGHLTILDLDAAGKEEIGRELRTINNGLEEAIREMDGDQ